MAEFNGHKNWTHWNVALWIGNNPGLYRAAKDMLTATGSKDAAAEHLLADLRRQGITHTPDGAAYSKTAIRAALRGL